ncbi:hypothetical protein [Providencia stuartii]|uniref:hypothetical protein n=1 Tax=Providencia stuartii TaxID=588 RepID=UPI001CEDB633
MSLFNTLAVHYGQLFWRHNAKLSKYEVNGSTINYSVDYPIYKWENNGAGTGGTRFYDSFTHHVTVWAI